MRTHVLVTIDYPPARGGVARYYGALVEALRDVPLHVLAPRSALEATRTDAKVRRATLLSRWTLPHWLPLLFTVLGVVLRRRVVLHAGQVLPVGTCAWIAHLLTGTPYLVYAHGLDVRAARRTRRKAWLATRILRGAALVVCNSGDTAAVIRAYGVPARAIVIVRPGCTLLDVPADAARSRALQERWGAAGRRIVLSVGRLVPRKGFAQIMQALALLRDLPDVHAVIIGDGPERERLRALAAALGLAHRVTIDPAVTDADLPHAYGAAAVFALAPQQTEDASDVEGFGIVFLEAAAFGVPAVSVRTGGVAEAVADGETGILVDDPSPPALARALRTLLTDEPLRRRLGEAARERAHTTTRWATRVAPLAARLAELTQSPLHRSLPRTANGTTAPPLRAFPKHDETISVVMPVFQGAHTIGRCLTSVLRQTIQPTEIIVVNDGSTDDLDVSLAPFRARITRLDQPNRGSNAARNRGMEASRGAFLLFCDADVLLAPTFLERLCDALRRHPSASYAYASFRFGWKPFTLWPFSAERLRHRNYIHTTSLIRREHFPGFDESLRRLQDWDLWLTMLERGHTGVWVPQELFRVLVEGKGISSWFPSFFLRVPWQRLGIRVRSVERFREAERIVRAKHRLPERAVH